MTRFILLLALTAGCPTRSPITNRACGGSCSSSVECRSGFDDCRSCFAGHCSATLPASPLDAGADASSGPSP